MATLTFWPVALRTIAESGGELPGAGTVKAFLAARGVTGEVVVRGNGEVVVETVADGAIVGGHVAAFVPATDGADPALVAIRILVGQVKTAIAAIEAVVPGSRTPIQQAALASMRLQIAVLKEQWRQVENGS